MNMEMDIMKILTHNIQDIVKSRGDYLCDVSYDETSTFFVSIVTEMEINYNYFQEIMNTIGYVSEILSEYFRSEIDISNNYKKRNSVISLILIPKAVVEINDELNIKDVSNENLDYFFST